MQPYDMVYFSHWFSHWFSQSLVTGLARVIGLVIGLVIGSFIGLQNINSLWDFDCNVGKIQHIAISVSAEEVTAPIPITKFCIGFGSRYRYRISVGH